MSWSVLPRRWSTPGLTGSVVLCFGDWSARTMPSDQQYNFCRMYREIKLECGEYPLSWVGNLEVSRYTCKLLARKASLPGFTSLASHILSLTYE